MLVPERLEASDILPWWRELVGELDYPGCHLLHGTPSMRKMMARHPSEALATLMDRLARSELEQRVHAELDEVVDHAIASSRRWDVRVWLRHWWLEGADDEEVERIAKLAGVAGRHGREPVSIEECDYPGLVAALLLRHDTTREEGTGKESVRLRSELLRTAIGLAIEEGWNRGRLGSDQRRELLRQLGRPVVRAETDDIRVEHWWTGKGEPVPAFRRR